eukprot:8308192-Heterocapsa_arctica.AAC.1
MALLPAAIFEEPLPPSHRRPSSWFVSEFATRTYADDSDAKSRPEVNTLAYMSTMLMLGSIFSSHM